MRSRADDETIVIVLESTEELIRKVADEVATKVADEVATKVATQVRQLADQVELRLNVHFENTSDLVKRAAEGFDATLGSIDRRLDRLEEKVDNGFRDVAHVLKDHEQRITALEQKP